MRKLKRRLEEDPGERPEPIPPGPLPRYRIEEKCGSCEHCKKEECHECEVCASRARGSRAHQPGPQEVACPAADRMCLRWKSPPLPPSSYASSVLGEVTRNSLRKCTQDVEIQMDKCVTATADVVTAIKNAGGGSWPKRPDLTEGNLEVILDRYQDLMEDMKQRLESKQIAMEQVESLDEEIPPGQGDGEEPPPGGSQAQGQSLVMTGQWEKQTPAIVNLGALGGEAPSMENPHLQERTSNEQLAASLQEALGELEANTRRQSQREAAKTKEAPPTQAPQNSLSLSLGNRGERGWAATFSQPPIIELF